MKKLLLILLCLPLMTLAQQTYVPDDNFEAHLEANGMGNGIANDDYVTTANINTVTNLFVITQNIADLTGIEDFTSLISLDCWGNQLTTLDISQNINLEFLDVGYGYSTSPLGNYLTSLDVSQNTVLQHLRCGNNQLTSLDVSQNTALLSLGCESNQLMSLDVSQNTALTWFSCWSNQLTSLDVSQNINLVDFQCSWNNLTNLDVTNNNLLEVLFVMSNQLTSLDVSQNNSLKWLYCDTNNLASLDVSNNTALTKLICASNNLTSLNLNNTNNVNFDTTSTGWWANIPPNNYSHPGFNTTNNTELNCIDVDNISWANANWTVSNDNIDPTMFFSTDCSIIVFGCTDLFSCNYDSLATVNNGSCIYFTESYDTIFAINNYDWNGTTLTSSGDYIDTLINPVGCDSIVNLNLTITIPSGILNITNTENTLLKITDMLGQETPYRRNTPLFYIYDDGTVEKRIVIE